MKRVIIRLNDKSFINVPGDSIDVRDGLVYACDGEAVIAVAKLDSIDVCYLSEKKEETAVTTTQ